MEGGINNLPSCVQIKYKVLSDCQTVVQSLVLYPTQIGRRSEKHDGWEFGTQGNWNGRG